MSQERDLCLFGKKFAFKDILYCVHCGGFIHFFDSSGTGIWQRRGLYSGMVK